MPAPLTSPSARTPPSMRPLPGHVLVRIDDVTRRDLLRGAGLLGMGWVLAGCGADGEDRAEETAGASTPSRTRSFDHVYGTTGIPVAPERIVATDLAVFGTLAAVDVRPVGAVLQSVVGVEYLVDQADGVTDVGTAAEEVNLEATAALDPDLLLALGVEDDEFYREQYEQLRAIGPTVAVRYDPATVDGVTALWQGVADAAGVAQRGVETVRDFRARLDTVRADIGRPLGERTVSVVQVGQDFVSARTGFFESAVLDAVGVSRPASQRDRSQGSVEISPEQVDLVDAYAVFLYAQTDAEDRLAELEANPLWARLEAVRAGRVFPVDAGVWNNVDPIAANGILDDVERHLGPLVG